MIMRDLVDYEERAVFYGTHPEAARAWKKEILARRKDSPLFDTQVRGGADGKELSSWHSAS